MFVQRLVGVARRHLLMYRCLCTAWWAWHGNTYQYILLVFVHSLVGVTQWHYQCMVFAHSLVGMARRHLPVYWCLCTAWWAWNSDTYQCTRRHLSVYLSFMHRLVGVARRHLAVYCCLCTASWARHVDTYQCTRRHLPVYLLFVHWWAWHVHTYQYVCCSSWLGCTQSPACRSRAAGKEWVSCHILPRPRVVDWSGTATDRYILGCYPSNKKDHLSPRMTS